VADSLEARIYNGLEKISLTSGAGREVGGGFRMGNMCTPMADSFMYGKTNTIL
jgi:hypothetical protein